MPRCGSLVQGFSATEWYRVRYGLLPGDVPIRLDEDDDSIGRVISLFDPDGERSTAESACPEAPSSTVQKRDCAGIKGAGYRIRSQDQDSSLKARRLQVAASS